MKTIFTIFCAIIIFSCSEKKNIKNIKEGLTIKNKKFTNKLQNENNIKEICVFDSLKMITSEYQNVKFYTENIMRGTGVLNLNIKDSLNIFNLDKSKFGNITVYGEFFHLNLPKNIIAREIIPDDEFKIFSFDAEMPEQNSNYLILYINKEKKLILKKDVEYQFQKWDEYIKSAFILLNEDVKNVSIAERNYWYEVVEIRNDSMRLRSVPKSRCDYIEDFKKVDKWIVWKNNNCKKIALSFCYQINKYDKKSNLISGSYINLFGLHK